MNTVRIIPADGKTSGMITVSDTLQIAEEFYSKNIKSLDDFAAILGRHEFQYWELKETMYSEALSCHIKVWEIDGELTVISERLDRYTMDDIRNIDRVIRVFDGQMISKS